MLLEEIPPATSLLNTACCSRRYQAAYLAHTIHLLRACVVCVCVRVYAHVCLGEGSK